MNYTSTLSTQDKEKLFWHLLHELSHEYRNRIMIFSTLTKTEVTKRFGVELSDEQWNFLKENFMTFYEFEKDYIKWMIEEAIYDLEKDGTVR